MPNPFLTSPLRDDAVVNEPRRGPAFTLGVYLAKRMAVYLMLTTFVLAFFIYLIDAMDLISQVSERNVSSLVALQMSLTKLPSLMLQVLPFAVLMATIIALQQLNRSSELVALRAAGLPARRFLVGPMLVVLAMGIGTLFLFNPLSATMLRSYERWRNEVFPGDTRGLVTEGGSIWMKQEEKDYDFFIYGRKIDPSGQVLNEATIFTYDGSGNFLARMDASRMVLEQGRWRMENLTVLKADQTVTRETVIYLPTTLTSQMIRNSFNRPGTLNVWELKKFIAVLKATGLPSSEHEMLYQRMLALPALLLAMFGLGVPFTLRYVRQGGLGLAIGAGLGMGFGFYLFSNYVATFGVAGRLNVTLAAWTPTLIAGLIATALMVQLREE